MQKTNLIIFIALLLGISDLNAQERLVSGAVIDSLTRSPLPFTNIGILNKAEGTISNSEGSYTLSLENVSPADTVFFSFVGYSPLKMSVRDLMNNPVVSLSESAIQLSDFAVLSRRYTPVEILDLVKENFDENHKDVLTHRQIFSRDVAYTTIHKNDIEYKKSSFQSIDEDFIKQFNEKMPEELNVYSDFLVNLYAGDTTRLPMQKGKGTYLYTPRKLVPIEGQSLVENWSFDEEFNKRIKMLAGDVESGLRDEDRYFKVRSGVFAGKLDFGTDSTFTLTDDSLHYITSTGVLLDDLLYLIRRYASINDKRWDFFTDYKWYTYALKDMAIINNELAYVITFEPQRNKGKYKGTICVAADSYALLQVDYTFAAGKTGRGLSLLGVDYLVANRSGRAVFEKGEDAHRLKYLSRESDERFAVDRTVNIKQKENKSGLFDKTLQEVKVKLDMVATFEQKKELLVVSNRKITAQEFERIKQPKTTKVNKVHKYSSDIWKNSSIIEPTKALKEYQQQF